MTIQSASFSPHFAPPRAFPGTWPDRPAPGRSGSDATPAQAPIANTTGFALNSVAAPEHAAGRASWQVLQHGSTAQPRQPAPPWPAPPAPSAPSANESTWNPLYVTGWTQHRIDFTDHAPFIKTKYESDSVHPSDVGQRNIGDCFLMSSLMTMAQQDPAALKRLIRDNGDGSYEVQLFSTNDDSWHRYHITQADLGETLPGTQRQVAAGGDRDANGRAEMWVRVIEAAYFREHHMDGGWASHALTALTGVRADQLAVPAPHSAWDLMRFHSVAGVIQQALSNHQPVVFETAAGIGDRTNSARLVQSHAYQLHSIRQEEGTGRWIVSLVNPWAGREEKHQPQSPGLALGEVYLDDAAKLGYIGHVSIGRIPAPQ